MRRNLVLDIPESIESLTRQEILDGVVEHFLIEKGKPSYEKDTNLDGSIYARCVYGKPKGTGCAIGLFLYRVDPGFRYPELNDLGDVIALFHVYPELTRLFGASNLSFLCRIQNAHDEAAILSHAASARKMQVFRRQLAHELQKISSDYSLTFNLPADSKVMSYYDA